MAPEPSRAARLGALIYGSCVTRDSFAYFDRDAFTVLDYVARQSLISAMSAPTTHTFDYGPIDSDFQRRMLQADAASELLSRLEKLSGRVDVIVWDLTDERLGVYQLPDGSFITRSPELITLGDDLAVPPGSRLIAFGSDEHFSRWTDAYASFCSALGSLGLDDRIVVICSPWASRDADGRPTPTSFGTTPTAANTAYERYFDHLRSQGRAVTVEVPQSLAVADAGHVWGPAPFHYIPDYYRFVTRQITAVVDSLQTHREDPAVATPKSRLSTGPDTARAPLDSAETLVDEAPHFRYEVPVLRHRTFGAITGATPSPAVHHVPIPGGPSLECYINARPGDRLYVVFHGAVRPGTDVYPRFDRITMMRKKRTPFVSFADPTLTLGDDLALAWYLGTATWDPIEEIAEVIRVVAEASGARDIVLLGGSGGGFAALRTAARFEGSLAFVFSPQSVVANYNRGHVEKYFDLAYPDMPLEAAIDEDPHRFSMPLLYSEKTPNNYVYYLQSLRDPKHVLTHYIPMKRALGVTEAQGTDPSGHFTFALYDAEREGHGPPRPEEFDIHLARALQFYDDQRYPELPATDGL